MARDLEIVYKIFVCDIRKNVYTEERDHKYNYNGATRRRHSLFYI